MNYFLITTQWKKNEFIELLKIRTIKFAVDSIFLVRSLPNALDSVIISRQLIKSSTSVAANYIAACRARSKAEFFSKISIAVEEADESLFWLELIEDTQLNNSENLKYLQNEALEITKILSVARKNAK